MKTEEGEVSKSEGGSRPEGEFSRVEVIGELVQGGEHLRGGQGRLPWEGQEGEHRAKG